MLVESRQKSLCLHQIGVNLAAVGERTHAGVISLRIRLHYQIPTVLAGVTIAKLYHLAELPFGINVHKRKGHLSGGERLFGQTHHHRRILAYGIEHHRILELGRHLSYYVD
jgi:hypothetical protein